MPALGSAFCRKADEALDVIRALESLRVVSAPHGVAVRELTPTRLEYSYEAAFLRVFSQWEVLLEEATIRYMCGYSSDNYVPNRPSTTAKQPNIPVARTSLLGSRPFALWHDPIENADRIAKWVDSCPVEMVMRSASPWLSSIGYVRHRIAHDTRDARVKFESASLELSGRRYRRGSVGRFLRHAERESSDRQIDRLVQALKSLALQVAP
jgi:hypothetical protein